MTLCNWRVKAGLLIPHVDMWMHVWVTLLGIPLIRAMLSALVSCQTRYKVLYECPVYFTYLGLLRQFVFGKTIAILTVFIF